MPTSVTKHAVTLAADAEKGAERAAATSSSIPSVNITPDETAIVLIEFQNEFASDGGKYYEKCKDCLIKYQTIVRSRRLMDRAREAGCTIIHVPIEFEKGHDEVGGKEFGVLSDIKKKEAFEKESWNSEFIDVMKPAPSDLICEGKRGLDAFFKTNLESLLVDNGIKTIVLCGFLTNCCIESTMRSAYERGYNVYTVLDCSAATSLEAHEGSFRNNFTLFSIPTMSKMVLNALS